MKIFLLLAGICILPALPGYSQKTNSDEYSGYVRYESTPVSGTVTLLSTGFGKNRAKTAADAATNAFYTLLFRGIPGSPYELPVIANEGEKKDNPVVKELLDNGYNSFLTESILQSEQKKKRKQDGAKGTMAVYKLTINCDALRRHLEKNGVIRKFGI